MSSNSLASSENTIRWAMLYQNKLQYQNDILNCQVVSRISKFATPLKWVVHAWAAQWFPSYGAI